ncbi:MAG: tetratricopeptide repeat protein [Bacteroidetes bacterium]|nr:tetratricopeptide repeat protein [Bacteroidota bacterium]
MELTENQALQQAVAAHQEGRRQDAERLYRAILRARPNHPNANHNLGVLLASAGETSEAVTFFQAALDTKPDCEQFWISLVGALISVNGIDEAETLAVEFTAAFPDSALAWNTLGLVLSKAQKLEASVHAFRSATELAPADHLNHFNLGLALKAFGALKEAEFSYRRALELYPIHLESMFNLANLFLLMDRPQEAEHLFKQLISEAPEHSSAHCNLGVALTKLGKADEAEMVLLRALELNPNNAKAYSNLGDCLKELCRLEEAERCYRDAVMLDPSNTVSHSNLLMFSASMRFDPDRHMTDLRRFSEAVHLATDQSFSTWQPGSGGDSLRVGFVSGDFGAHPVGYFLEHLLRALKVSSLKLNAYPTTDRSDGITGRLQSLFDSWTPIYGLSDGEAAAQIRSDGVQVLIDLSGHTAFNRLPMFAMKPAPVQMSWLGYFGSTGLPEIDYVLGDSIVMPDREKRHFVEGTWQLPDCYLCFTTPNFRLDVACLPAITNEFITFGCFNNLAKMTDDVIRVRSEILRAVPNSKLFLKDKQLDHESGRQRISSKFLAHGISADRLVLDGKSGRYEYLKCYDSVDIALSPFPYGGGTTAVEGLWMGVPVIFKSGSHFLSHIGESIARAAGLEDLVAHSDQDYVSKAVQLSSDLELLARLRNTLRGRLMVSPLFDSERFARNFEMAIKDIWTKSVAG